MFAGVVENILGRVLDAFQAHMHALLGNAACKTLAENPQLALLMAREPAAPQARAQNQIGTICVRFFDDTTFTIDRITGIST